ncbi:MAG: DUF1573 domain-containing protein, partial [Sporichthyaceae bacterium]|nr:DUF1573 domain-containing protein [Sporichthyaceae bacterium]
LNQVTHNPTSPDALTHDAGRVIAGEEVAHLFPVTNTSGETLTVLRDEDVYKNCGCSDVVPESRRLEPGAETRVKVVVHTAGRDGPFAHGGYITWTSAGGSKRTTHFTLHGVAVAPLVSTPKAVELDDQAIKAGTVHELKLSGNVPVDWASAQVSGSSPHIQVLDWKATPEGGTVRVRCILPPDQEALNGNVFVRATVTDPASPLDEHPVTLSVPVRARQQIGLLVRPEVVPLAWSAAGDRATARLMLRGELLAKDKRPVEAVECAGYSVEWKMTEPTASHVAILSLTLVPSLQPAEGDPKLVIRVKGRDPIRLSVSMVRPGK